MEKGTTFIDALKIEVNSLKDLKEIVKAIKDAGKPYKYITIDTITAVEDMARPLAIKLYQDSPLFSTKYADVKDITQLPNGSGWAFLRQAVEMIVDLVASATDNIIICGHVKDTSLSESVDGSVKDLDLGGKLKRILSARSDAIGLTYKPL